MGKDKARKDKLGKESGDATSGMRPQLLGKVRRQAAKVVGTLLQGDADRRASASIKSLIYAPSVVAKKATLALTCQTLKYLPVIKEVIAFTDLLSGKRKMPLELLYVLVCDLLFGQDVADTGDAEKQVLKRKSALRAALARLLVKRNVSNAEELLPPEVQNSGPAVPRYVPVEIDDLIQDLLVLPPGTDLHKHPLILNGSLVLQGKASCMPAQALAPDCDWEVLDACAAPGNKTVHLAALMAGRGKVIACEINEKRAQRFQENVQLTGASNVTVRQQDFLTIDPNMPEFAKVRGILLDPSCSGSGTTVQRLDHLLPSAGAEMSLLRWRTVLPSSDPSQAAEDCGPESGSAKRSILKSQKPQAGNGAESDRKKKKKVTFQLPYRVEDEPSGKELLGKETELTDLESPNWTTDKLRPGLVYGMYTAEEDGLLKQAVFDYIQEKGWDREEGLEKILNSRSSEARGCWHVIRKCLPQRELKRIYARAHRILGPGTLLGKWSDEEMQSLIELHSVHGNDWKRIGTIIGRDPEACYHKWRYLKWSTSKDYKSGPWSEEEQQKLCELVLKCLHVKAQMAKKGLTTKDHRIIRDDINWEFIAEQMGGRGRLDCLTHWYRRMASPMVTTGEWSNGDDQRLLGRLMEEFPLSEELVEWDSLLDNRSGETCNKRWEQMQRTLGRGPDVRHQHFLEKLESVMKRFAPYLLDTEYDQKFAEDMQSADADEPEDLDV